MKKIFITGTDTEVGKTYVSKVILQQCNEMNLKTFGIKPIASGCETDSQGKLLNEDALILQETASIKKPYDVVNPISFKDPIAPHLAAENENQLLTKKAIVECINESIQEEADINLIEGAGGWTVPLNDKEYYGQVAVTMQLPIVLVVGIKLGCLNHAILTVKSILQDRGKLIGWVANRLQPDSLLQHENIQTLQTWLPIPYLGQVMYQSEENDMIAKKIMNIE